MVRTKNKKAKGDSAFTKQKQKVGRKKLAPATATRAEVHARTLRLSTSAAMTAAMAAPNVVDPVKHPPSSATTTAGQKTAAAAAQQQEGERRTRPVIAVQNFSELLAGTHHYKAAQRASSFATLTRLLTAQKAKDEAVASTSRTASAFDEYIRYAATEKAAATALHATGKPSAAGLPAGLSGLTALEKLKAFAAALEAVTDTDDNVRRGALQSLEVLVDFHWISPDGYGLAWSCHRHGSSLSLSTTVAAGSSAPTATTQDTAELKHCNALLLDVQSGHPREAERVLGSLSATATGTATATSAAASSTVSVDRVQAVLQTIHVALTHALKSVRLSGVELLALLLRVAPPSLVRAAARAVCRHQTAYCYHSHPIAMGSGLTMDGVQSTSKGTAGDHDVSVRSALTDAQPKMAALVEEEEKWILTLVRRVSSLVLRTKHMNVLPALLGVFLGNVGSSGESTMADLLRSCLDERSINDRSSSAESGAATATTMSTTVEMADKGSLVWRYPGLVNSFFDEIAPQWANHWKELMELRLELLRQEDKLAMASSLALSFATVLVFLKRQQQQQQQGNNGGLEGGTVNFFSRNRVYFVKALFIEKMPVTMQELLAPSAVGSRGMEARLELGLALVMACVPLAGTDEGWHLMREYFSLVFSVPRKPQVVEKGEEAGDGPASTPAQPFRFPSIILLEKSVRLYEQVLRLYPCTATHVRLEDDDGEGCVSGSPATVAHAAETALWGVPSTTSSSVASQYARLRREKKTLSPAQRQHSTVAVRLLSFFPALLNTVTRHVVPRTESTGTSVGGVAAAAGSEDVALVRTLLCTAHILDRLAAFPDDLLCARNPRQNNNSRNGSLSQSRADDGSAVAKKLEEGFALVPRLLFALREQTPISRPFTLKRTRADEVDDEVVEEEKYRETSTTAEALKPRVGALLAYPAIVDALVRRLLRVLWFLSSSGHPLLMNAESNDSSSRNRTDSACVASPFALLLKKSIAFLFGQAQTDVAGVLQRCAVPTILLAHSILYYLGAVERSAVEVKKGEAEMTAVEEAAVKWGDVLDAMRAKRV